MPPTIVRIPKGRLRVLGQGGRMQGQLSPVVDASFLLMGQGGETVIPADHGYALYSAVSRILPWIHSDTRIGIHPISGRLAGGRGLLLSARARLTIRASADLLPAMLPLAGKTLDLDGRRLQVGAPTVHALHPAASLISRLVTIKGMLSAESLLEAARAQLGELQIAGEPALLPRAGAPFQGGAGGRDPWVRRTLRIKDKTIVGYAVAVTGLTAEESLSLQEAGLGGRRRFGCGIFVPMRGGQ